MDLDNIIYIIATIVIFVVSLLGQKKKKVEVPLKEQEEEGIYSLNDFEKILERKHEYRQHEQEEVVEAEEKIEEQPEKIEKLKEVEHNKKKLDKTQEEEENQDGFDVKSAIIYSSILERKKFRH